jgi:hypothetical protein
VTILLMLLRTELSMGNNLMTMGQCCDIDDDGKSTMYICGVYRVFRKREIVLPFSS